MTQAHGLPTEHVREDMGRGSREQVNPGSSVRGEGAAGHRNPLSSARDARDGATWPECPTPASTLNQPGRTKGMWPTLWLVTASQGDNKPLTFPPQPWTNTSKYEGTQTERQAGGDHSHPHFKPRPHHQPWWGGPMKCPSSLMGRK